MRRLPDAPVKDPGPDAPGRDADDDTPRRSVVLDLERLQAQGVIVVPSTRSTPAEQFRRIKRPLLANMRMPQASWMALAIAGNGPLMPISAILFAPKGPDGSKVSTRIVLTGGASAVVKIL